MTQAEQFDILMRAVWRGIVDDDDTAYEKDAVEHALTMGAKTTGAGKQGDQGKADEGAEWIFPDGSTINIITNTDGVGVGVTKDIK